MAGENKIPANREQVEPYLIDTSPLGSPLVLDNEPEFPLPIETPVGDPRESFHVNYLKAQFMGIKDVARANQFKVEVIPPADVFGNEWDMSNINFMVLAKNVKLPSITMKEWAYVRAGQKIYIPTGEADHGEASITFYNDADYNLYTMFQRWIRYGVHNWQQNVGSIPRLALGGKVSIFHFNYNLQQVYEYQLMNAWPKSISEIDLNQETENTAEEFTVGFNYSQPQIFKNKG